ncbi:hypothetical protein K491DRAFT_690745, partial [Lophiostoma macrostomum CBS 122681]
MSAHEQALEQANRAVGDKDQEQGRKECNAQEVTQGAGQKRSPLDAEEARYTPYHELEYLLKYSNYDLRPPVSRALGLHILKWIVSSLQLPHILNKRSAEDNYLHLFEDLKSVCREDLEKQCMANGENDLIKKEIENVLEIAEIYTRLSLIEIYVDPKRKAEEAKQLRELSREMRAENPNLHRLFDLVGGRLGYGSLLEGD